MSEGGRFGEARSNNLGVGIWVAGTLLAGTVAAGPAEAHTSALYPTDYSLRVTNQSKTPADFAVFQIDPEFSGAAVPLVWQDVPLKAKAEAGLSWDASYSFSVSPSADLTPGAIYRPAQTLTVAPGVTQDDGADLTDAQGVLGLHRAGPSEQSADTLTLKEPSTIPTGAASVALGMAGRPASALKAEADQTLHFTPHPEYWITAGTFTEGEVINPRTVSHPLRLHFGTNAVTSVMLHQGGRLTFS